VAVAELTRLIDEEDALGQQIGSIGRRLGKLDQLSSSLDDYGVTLTAQEDRLQGVGWFEQKLREPHECPVCSAVHTDGNPRLAELKTLASELKTLTASVHEAPAKLDQEVAALRQELRGFEGAISKTRQKRKYLENQTAAQAAHRQRVRQIYLFVGRVEQALENVTVSRNVDALREQVNIFTQRISELKRELDPNAQRDRLNAAIDSVSAKIAEYAHLLSLEHASENVRLNIRELTLQFNPLSGRTDYLWEVGSGQNWVGYHIAGLLALHEHFIRLTRSPVPRFVMIDQPSQVYFPEAWPTMDKSSTGLTKGDGSSDIEGVRRIFRALSHFMESVTQQFQVIVTEHAGSITWQGIANVHLVGNWRANHDEFLIPTSWIKPVGAE
jgi:predicted  nucleic acid-binding Zn-ribbon protein